MAKLPNCNKTMPWALRLAIGGWGTQILVLHTFPKSPQDSSSWQLSLILSWLPEFIYPTLIMLTDCISKDFLVHYSFKQKINEAPQINFCYLCSFCYLTNLNDHFHHFGRRTPPWLAVAFFLLKLESGMMVIIRKQWKQTPVFLSCFFLLWFLYQGKVKKWKPRKGIVLLVTQSSSQGFSLGNIHTAFFV